MGQHTPTNFRVIEHGEDTDAAGGASPGGRVRRGTAGQTLNIGDFVVLVPGIRRWFKTLGNSYYAGGCQTGIVVGGKNTYMSAILDAGAIGVAAGIVGDDVYVMTRGVCYGIADATGIKAGKAFSAGRTTAGRIIGDMLTYFAEITPGQQRSAGTSTLSEAAFAARTVFAGGPGTALAAGVDYAALVGTVTVGQFGLWEFRTASNGTTMTAAPGSLVAATKPALTLPAGSAALITLGFLIVNPTVGSFVGGTTALDDGAVIPRTEYYDLVGSAIPRGMALQDGGAAASAVLVELF